MELTSSNSVRALTAKRDPPSGRGKAGSLQAHEKLPSSSESSNATNQPKRPIAAWPDHPGSSVLNRDLHDCRDNNSPPSYFVPPRNPVVARVHHDTFKVKLPSGAQRVRLRSRSGSPRPLQGFLPQCKKGQRFLSQQNPPQ